MAVFKIYRKKVCGDPGMKTNIFFTQKDFNMLRSHLLRGRHADEEAAFLTAGLRESEEQLSLLVREVIPIPDDVFISKGPLGLLFSPEFISGVVKKCRYEKLSVILAHSHPFSNDRVGFSGIDDQGEAELFPKIQQRVPGQHHGAMVFGQSSIDGRIWRKDQNYSEPIQTISVIGNVIWNFPCSGSNNDYPYVPAETYVRQIHAFTEKGQRCLERITVGIVGLGGVGSQVFQQLIHLGVKKFILIDSDKIEESNRSKIVGSRPEDVQKKSYKVHVISNFGKQINPEIKVKEIIGTIYHKSIAYQLRDADVIFCCTDTMVSRMVLSRMAFQYLIPIIDMGIDIQLDENGRIYRIGGRVMVISPDGPCLECMDILNQDMLAKETASPDETLHNPYIQGGEVHALSVITFNGVIASLASTEFINLITGFLDRPSEKTYQVYDGKKGLVRTVQMIPVKECYICTEVKGLGDGTSLPCILNR